MFLVYMASELMKKVCIFEIEKWNEAMSNHWNRARIGGQDEAMPVGNNF